MGFGGLVNVCQASRFRHKVCRCYLVPFLNLTPILIGCVVRWGSKNGNREDTCLKAIGLCLQIVLTIPHSKVGICN